MERMMSRLLRAKYERIPQRTVVMHDWHSVEGQEFLEAVKQAVESGVDIYEVGEAIGIRDFSSRWKVIGRKR